MITGGGITLPKPVGFTVFHSRCFTHGVSRLPLKPDGIGMCFCVLQIETDSFGLE